MRMSPAEARELFTTADVARLATVGPDGHPHLVPVTFAILTVGPRLEPAGTTGDLIVFAVDHKPKSTRRLRRLKNIRHEPRVALLADRYDDDWDQLWWVRADATAAVIEDIERDRALDALAAKYPQYAQRRPDGLVVAAAVTVWSGWRAAWL